MRTEDQRDLDLIATFAMQGILVSLNTTPSSLSLQEMVAKHAYELADVMLAERKRRENTESFKKAGL